MTACLDTDVLVDCLRGVPEAAAWLREAGGEALVVPGVVVMELLAGCRNQTELARTQRFVGGLRVVWPEAGEFARACDLLVQHRLAIGLSIPDCLVAAMALQRSWHLYTFNLRHYRVIAGLDVREPYHRPGP